MYKNDAITVMQLLVGLCGGKIERFDLRYTGDGSRLVADVGDADMRELSYLIEEVDAQDEVGLVRARNEIFW